MTDIFNDDDRQQAQQDRSFKERILEEMRQAAQEREKRLAEEEKARQEALVAAKQAEEEALLEAKRLAQKEAERQAELEAQLLEQTRREEESKALAAQKEALESKAKLDSVTIDDRAELAHDRDEHMDARRQMDLLFEAERELIKRELELDNSLGETGSSDVSAAAPVDLDAFQTSSFSDRDDSTVVDKAVLAEDDLSLGDPTRTVSIDEVLFEDDDISDYDDYIVTDPSFRVDKQKVTSSLARTLSLVLGSVMVALVLILAVLGFSYVSSAIGPLDRTSTDYIQVEIPSGSGNKLIGKLLEDKGVIKNGTVFNYYTKFKNYTNFQSGYYNFQKSMSLDDISKLLQEGGTPEPVLPALGKIVIPEGYTLTQIAKAVALNGATPAKQDASPFTEADFLALVANPDFIGRMVEKYPDLLGSLPEASLVKYQLEGYLFPATYSYHANSSLEGILEEMLAATDANLAPYYGAIAERGMTVREVLTLASLIEKEGSTDEDRQQIASVFYNRLGIDMPLQSNIALLYAMDKLGERTTLAEDAAIDTAIDSPYNVYANTGLMPGPVDSPSLKAILATISPAQTDYLYFVADVTTGKVYYAETYDEHEANVEQYVNNNLPQ